MIRVQLVGVRVEVPSNQPIMLLREDEGEGRRYLPIFIGSPEATAIFYALQGMETPRPMTHDLFTTVLAQLGARITRVAITDLSDGTYYAEIEIDAGGETHRISARPSDAVALAVRAPQPVPLYAAEEVLEEAGVIFESEEEEEEIEQFREFLDQVTPEDFA